MTGRQAPGVGATEVQGRFATVSAEARRALSRGESDQVEYKLTARALTPADLAAAANWTAQHPDRGPVTFLVGVREELTSTGATVGVVAGLPARRLQSEVETIQQRVRTTHPVPVGVAIYEENTKSSPFLRVEVWATAPPHYDDQGHRQTRQGPTTRPLSDVELLDMHVVREADRFDERFRVATNAMAESLTTLMADVEASVTAFEERLAHRLGELQQQTEAVGELAAEAAGAAEEAAAAAAEAGDGSESGLGSVETMVAHLLEVHPKWSVIRLVRTRQMVWAVFLKDVEGRHSRAADLLRDDLRALLLRPVDPADTWAIATELGYWKDHPTGWDTRKPMTWWRLRATELALIEPTTTVELDLMPDVPAELAKVDRMKAAMMLDVMMDPNWDQVGR